MVPAERPSLTTGAETIEAFPLSPGEAHRHRWDGPLVEVGSKHELRPTCIHCRRPNMKESHFREEIVGWTTKGGRRGLADQLGWEHVGFRPARVIVGGKPMYRTPGTGTMARGWPDLTLVHPRSGRLLFVELKGDGGELDPDQERVLDVLRRLPPPVEVHVWWPDDLEEAGRVLMP